MTHTQLVDLMKHTGWKRKDVARMLGVSVAAVGRWCTGAHAISPPVERFILILATNTKARRQARLMGNG